MVVIHGYPWLSCACHVSSSVHLAAGRYLASLRFQASLLFSQHIVTTAIRSRRRRWRGTVCSCGRSSVLSAPTWTQGYHGRCVLCRLFVHNCTHGLVTLLSVGSYTSASGCDSATRVSVTHARHSRSPAAGPIDQTTPRHASRPAPCPGVPRARRHAKDPHTAAGTAAAC